MNCPICNHPIDAHTSITGECRPVPGDVSICFYCGNIFVFSEALELRDPTPSEWVEINANELIQRTRALIRSR